MGIVVTIIMLFGLYVALPLPLSVFKKPQGVGANVIGFALLLGGIWNSFWHGLRYLDYFWGIAALISGFFMILVAIVILKQNGSQSVSSNVVIAAFYKTINPLSIVWITGLLLSFLLYFITLVRLNLGLPIIS